MGSDVLGGFLKGFTAGWALMPSKDEREYTRAKTDYTKAMAEYYRTGKSSSTGMRDANYASQIAHRDRRAAEIERHNRAMEGKKSSTGEASAVGLDDPDIIGALPDDPYADPSMDSSDDFTTDVDDVEADTGIPLPYSAPEDFYARGGPVTPPPKHRQKVTRYANGGGVVSDDDEVTMPVTPPPVQGMPMNPAPMSAPEPKAIPAPGDAPTAEGQPTLPQGFSYTAAVDAAVAGIEDVAKEHGLGADAAMPDPAAKNKKVEAFDKDTKDAASPDQMEELRKRFDPEGRLSMDQVNTKVLASVYEIYLKQGNAAKATKAAAAIYKHYKMMHNRFRGIASAAAEGGKPDEAAMAMLKAYAYVPDGAEVELQKTKSGRYAFQYTDQKTGKVVARGLKTPEEILSMATRGGIPSFEELIAAAAGDPATASVQPPSNTAKLEDTRRTTQAATERVDKALGMEGTGASKEAPFRVTSQAELDQLPPGTWVSVDGRVGQKQAPKATP